MTSIPVLPPPPRPSRRARRWLLPALAVAAAAVVAGLALFQPWKLWIDETVNEAAPVAAAGSPTTAAAPATTAAAPPTSAAPVAPAPTTTPPALAEPSTTAPAPTAPPTTPAPVAPPATVPTTAAAAPAPPVEPAPTELSSRAHTTTGIVRLLTLEDGSRVLRIEDLRTDNGPDVKVVLSPDPDGYTDGAVSLGTLKGNRGSQNYAIPADVDLTSVRSVVIWCKRFNVDFGVAPFPT